MARSKAVKTKPAAPAAKGAGKVSGKEQDKADSIRTTDEALNEKQEAQVPEPKTDALAAQALAAEKRAKTGTLAERKAAKAEAKAARAELKKAKAEKGKEPKVPITDYSVVFPALKAGLGIGDVAEVARIYAEHRTFFDSVLSFFKGLLRKKPATVPPAPFVPGPVVTFPTLDTNPQAAGPLGGLRPVTALLARPYWIEKGGKPIPKDEFDKVLSKERPLASGETLHVEVVATDPKGLEIGPGSAELAQLIGPTGQPTVVHHVTVDGGDAIQCGQAEIVHAVGDTTGRKVSLALTGKASKSVDGEASYWVSAPSTFGPSREIVSNSIVVRVK